MNIKEIAQLIRAKRFDSRYGGESGGCYPASVVDPLLEAIEGAQLLRRGDTYPGVPEGPIMRQRGHVLFFPDPQVSLREDQ